MQLSHFFTATKTCRNDYQTHKRLTKNNLMSGLQLFQLLTYVIVSNISYKVLQLQRDL